MKKKENQNHKKIKRNKILRVYNRVICSSVFASAQHRYEQFFFTSESNAKNKKAHLALMEEKSVLACNENGEKTVCIKINEIVLHNKEPLYVLHAVYVRFLHREEEQKRKYTTNYSWRNKHK